MEEELLKILDKHKLRSIESNGSISKAFISNDSRPALAKEIADHFRKFFIEWWLKCDHKFIYISSVDRFKNIKTRKLYTLDEVYNYYRDNILKKQP